MKRLWILLVLAGCGSSGPEWPTEAIKCAPSDEVLVAKVKQVVLGEDPEAVLNQLAEEQGPTVLACAVREGIAQLSRQRSARAAAKLDAFLSRAGVKFQED